jgi:hypothetical protein
LRQKSNGGEDREFAQAVPLTCFGVKKLAVAPVAGTK